MSGSRRRFGSVRKLPSGRYQASYVGPDGQRHTAPGTYGNRTDAARWLSLVESEILKGNWLSGPARKLRLEEWAADWMAAAEPQLKRTTVSTYRSILKLCILPVFGNRVLRDVRPIDVGQWMAALIREGKSPSWVCKAYRLLSQIMSAAADNDLIVMNPCRGHRLPRLPEPDPRILTLDEVDLLVQHSKRPFGLLILLLAFTGMRIGECLSLRRNDVLKDGRLLRIDERKAEPDGVVDFDTPKSHQIRKVELPAFLAELLVKHLAGHVGPEPEAFLFVGRTGKALRYNSWKRWKFDRAVAAAKLDGITPHDLRATHGSWVADSHGVMAAAKRLGHSNANVTTRHYARAVDGRDAEIAASFDAQWERRAASVSVGQHDDVARGLHEQTDDHEPREQGGSEHGR